MFSIIIFVTLFILIIGCTKKEVDTGDTVSYIYGVSYYKFWNERGVCYPIPFNIVVHFLYRSVRWLRSPRFIIDRITREIHNAEKEKEEI